jgi:hypothetical protein
VRVAKAARSAVGVVGDTDDLAALVDRGRLCPAACRVGAGRFGERRDGAVAVAHEAVVCTLDVDIGADDLPTVVDAQGRSRRRARDVDRLVGAVVPEEAVQRTFGVHVETYDPAPIVDLERAGQLRTRNADLHEPPLRTEKAGRRDPRVVVVEADDLAAVVDVDGLVAQPVAACPRRVVDDGEAAPPVADEMADDAAAVFVHAQDLAAIVDAKRARPGLSLRGAGDRRGVRVVDRRDDTALGQESVACGAGACRRRIRRRRHCSERCEHDHGGGGQRAGEFARACAHGMPFLSGTPSRRASGNVAFGFS